VTRQGRCAGQEIQPKQLPAARRLRKKQRDSQRRVVHNYIALESRTNEAEAFNAASNSMDPFRRVPNGRRYKGLFINPSLLPGVSSSQYSARHHTAPRIEVTTHDERQPHEQLAKTNARQTAHCLHYLSGGERVKEQMLCDLRFLRPLC